MKHIQTLYKEENILTLLPKNRLNEKWEDEWPEFTLNEVTVVDKNNRMVSVLNAGDDNLLTLTGSLKNTGIEKYWSLCLFLSC
jgi:hypothetical protein